MLYQISELLLNQDYVNFELLKVEHLKLEKSERGYAFIPKTMTIYEVDQLFSEKKLNGEKFSVAFITETGNPNEDLLGIISSSDVNVIDQYLFVE